VGIGIINLWGFQARKVFPSVKSKSSALSSRCPPFISTLPVVRFEIFSAAFCISDLYLYGKSCQVSASGIFGVITVARGKDDLLMRQLHYR
jgi:hypothetical protein